MLIKIAAVLSLIVSCSTSVSTSAPPTRVADKCVQTQTCIIGYHWDKQACACLPNVP